MVVHETQHGQIIFFVYSRQREAAFAMSASVVVHIIKIVINISSAPYT